jgi:hypothetical protein
MRLEHFSYLLYMSSAYRDSTQLLRVHFAVWWHRASIKEGRQPVNSINS